METIQEMVQATATIITETTMDTATTDMETTMDTATTTVTITPTITAETDDHICSTLII